MGKFWQRSFDKFQQLNFVRFSFKSNEISSPDFRTLSDFNRLDLPDSDRKILPDYSRRICQSLTKESRQIPKEKTRLICTKESRLISTGKSRQILKDSESIFWHGNFDKEISTDSIHEIIINCQISSEGFHQVQSTKNNLVEKISFQIQIQQNYQIKKKNHRIQTEQF